MVGLGDVTCRNVGVFGALSLFSDSDQLRDLIWVQSHHQTREWAISSGRKPLWWFGSSRLPIPLRLGGRDAAAETDTWALNADDQLANHGECDSLRVHCFDCVSAEGVSPRVGIFPVFEGRNQLDL